MVVVDEAAALLEMLRGQVLRVPGEDELFGQWFGGISPMYDSLVVEVNQTLGAVIRDQQLCRKVEAMDPALFASICYIESGSNQLKTMAFIVAALILWDDVLDQEFPPEYPNLETKLAEIDEFRQVSISYVEHSFFPRPSQELGVPPDDACAAFKEAVPSLLEAGETQLQRECFVEDMCRFLRSSDDEQRQRASGKLPTIEEFWRYRNDTGVSDLFCSMHQYMADTRLSPDLAISEEVIAMRREASTQAVISNDLLSLRKEVASGSTSNVCIIMAHIIGTSLDEVTEHLRSQILESHVRFDEAACKLKIKANNDALVMQKEVDRFIQVFENYQTGIFTWCSRSKRYGIAECRQPDGSLEILL